MSSLFPLFFPIFTIVIVIVARRPITHLRRRGAVSPETAQTVDDMSASDRKRLDRYVAQGLIREASPGRYYHDAAGERERTRKQLPIIIGLVVLLLGAGIALGWLISHNAART